MAENASAVIGIELLCAAQGIDFHRPLTSSEALERAHKAVRARSDFYTCDRYFAPDIEGAKTIVMTGELTDLVAEILPSTYMGSEAL